MKLNPVENSRARLDRQFADTNRERDILGGNLPIVDWIATQTTNVERLIGQFPGSNDRGEIQGDLLIEPVSGSDEPEPVQPLIGDASSLQVPSAILRNGARGSDVITLQQSLTAAGFNPGTADGIFGPKTESAVRAYQSAKNLTVDGIVGPQTWRALGAAVDPTSGPSDIDSTSGPSDITDIAPDGPVPLTGDAVSDDRIAQLHPEIQHRSAAFVNEVKQELGIQLRVTDGLRTFDEQNALYAKGRTSPGDRVTNARGGSSYHNYGLAIDVVELRPDGSVNYETDYNAIAEIGKQYGFGWGGDFRSLTDKPHFEFTGGYSTRELRELSNNGANPFVDLD